MRSFVFDTCVLINYLLDKEVYRTIVDDNNLDEEDVTIYLPLAVKAEILTAAYSRNWGAKKMNQLHKILGDFFLIYPDDIILQKYVQTELYSRGKDPENDLGRSAVTMGKNDLWIVSTSLKTHSVLLTTDNDFSHLVGKEINGDEYRIKIYPT